MTQYNTTNVIFSNSELNKLKCAMKNGTEVTLHLSLKVLIMKLIFHIDNYLYTSFKNS